MGKEIGFTKAEIVGLINQRISSMNIDDDGWNEEDGIIAKEELKRLIRKITGKKLVSELRRVTDYYSYSPKRTATGGSYGGKKKMGIDKETKLKYLNIVMEDTPKYLKSLREQAEEDGQNDDDGKKLSLTMDGHSFQTEEYYFELDFTTKQPVIEFNSEMSSPNGTTWVSFSLPLSDVVLIDIIEYSIKKLAKLKTAMEALK